MSGHSKWAGIKHKKAIVDAKRGQAFTRASREITISAREGGGNPEGNFRLRLAMQKAREINMPTDRIKNAIQRGTGELAGEKLEEVRYEGYGPGGVAVMVDTLTDNRNRTSASIRHRFSKGGGNLAESNAVGWMFERKGVITANAG
ncbi:MAG: YebC/PmpR family DNA-binding transcriptional regulator, partial [Chloroflexi bacterium]